MTIKLKDKTVIEANELLANRVKELRKNSQLSLRDLAAKSGLSYSALAKIEKAQLSPTYESLIRLCNGFSCDIIDLITQPKAETSTPNCRLAVTRAGKGLKFDTANYCYELLCSNVTKKNLTPVFATIKANNFENFGPLIAHEGEEVLYILSGVVEIHTEFYKPERLEKGDCIYFDSSMKHGCIAHGIEDAEVFWISSHSQLDENSHRDISENRLGYDIKKL